jgi:hypothetical protein
VTDLNVFLAGVQASAAAAVAISFARMHRRMRDLLFVWFSAAFALLAVERVLTLTLTQQNGETSSPLLYLVRILAFTLILIAIVQKNRSAR